MTIFLIYLLIILFAIWNGHTIRWQKTGIQLHSKIWHRIGFAIRAILCLILFLEYTWWIALIAAAISWLPYNMIINYINHWPIFYFGKSSIIDRFFRKFF